MDAAPTTKKVARVTGLEPAASGVTGRRSNQLSYTRILDATFYRNQVAHASTKTRKTNLTKSPHQPA